MENQYNPYVYWLQNIDKDSISEVGAKNASLGEMLKHLSSLDLNIPKGFITTDIAYYKYIEVNELKEPIDNYLKEFRDGKKSVGEVGRAIRKMIHNGIFPIPIAESIRSSYARLCDDYHTDNVDVAVRSSAFTGDIPSESFAGLQETFLNVRGEEELLKACRACYASLFTARAIEYREENGFDPFKVALSICVQKMIRSDNSCSGVISTIDTDTGFPNAVVIKGVLGLGEINDRGIIDPDRFVVFKPLVNRKDLVPILEKTMGNKKQKMVFTSDDDSRIQNVHTTPEERGSYVLNDAEILKLAQWSKLIEEHFGNPMNIEWIKDDRTNELYIIQALETRYSRSRNESLKNYRLLTKGHVLLTGLSVGSCIVEGRVKKIESVTDLSSITREDILVTAMIEPEWIPDINQAAGIITDSSGQIGQEAYIAHKMSIPAIVGTQFATTVMAEGQKVTMSCSEGEEGKIYDGTIQFTVEDINLEDLPVCNTDIMVNLTLPESAFKWWRLPVQGVGLARMEHIIKHHIKVHPMALIHFDRLVQQSEREEIRKLTRNYEDKSCYFVEKLARSISKMAASQYPRPVILQTSDLKTNEYTSLVGGQVFEPLGQNPMLGWRGACRYYSEGYREAFALECRAIKMVREEIGLDNVIVMIPFCRTVGEAKEVLNEMARNGLKRGKDGLKVYLTCKVPSNVILAEEFASYFDGFSVESSDLAQLILGVDRNFAGVSYLFDESNSAVMRAIKILIEKAHMAGIRVGFCSQSPADDPKYAAFLVEAGIDSISVNPDDVVNIINRVSMNEKKLSVNA